MSVSATEVEFDPILALERGIAELKAKADEAALNRRYHEGEHPRLEWITKIRKVFGDEVADQIHQANYCEPAIEKPLARMAVHGLGDETAEELFRLNGLHLTQDDAYRDSLVVGSGYVIVAEAEPGAEVPYDIVVQRSEDCHVEYGSLKPNDRIWAVKVWGDPTLGEEGGYRAMVWDTVNFWRYVAPVGDPDAKPMPSAGDFEPDLDSLEGPEGAHGFDKVPVVEFKRGRNPRSRLTSLRPVQDRIDMLEICKVVAGLFGASRQRVYFTHQELTDGDTEASPDFAIVLDPGNDEDGRSSVTEFQHTPLENFDNAIDAEIDRFYDLATLPKHSRINAGGQSGEAKKADEGDFVETIKGYTENAFTDAWREVFGLLGIDVDVQWIEPQTRDESTDITNVKMAVDAGAPLEWALRFYLNLSEDDLVEFRKALETERAEAEAAREAAMLAFEQGREPGVVRAEQFD